MLPLGIKGTEMTVRRTASDGTVNESKLNGADLGADDGITFSVDADIEVGDEVSYELPNGKTRTMRIQGTQVNKNPFGVASNLDHTVAKYEVVTGKGALRQPLASLDLVVSAVAATGPLTLPSAAKNPQTRRVSRTSSAEFTDSMW